MKHIKILFLSLLLPTLGYGQLNLDTYYGKANVPVDSKTKSPKTPTVDAFGSETLIDGRTDVSLDARSMAAQKIEDEQAAQTRQAEVDKSIRADISSGEPITVLIAPEHFVQLSFLKNGEIVYPKRAFTGQPELVVIDKKENSPYIYIEATAMVEGQTTNLFVETEEDGKIQTYVINLLVTQPRNIRAQVSVNLVDDRTPPIKGGEGSEEQLDKQMNGNQPPSVASGNPSSSSSSTSSSSSIEKVVGTSVSGKFTESEVKQYFSTMIEMANHFNEAKQIEKKTGRKIYRDTDIKIYTGGKNNYVDPVENTVWEISQIWFFPKYDALLFDVRVNNPSKNTSMWDFSQVRWQPNNSPKNFSSTAAAPLSMQTLPERTNQIWYLVQGNRLDPSAEFSPIFPRAERRGNQTVKNPEPEPSHKPKTKN